MAGLMYAGIVEEEAVYVSYILNSNTLTQFAGVKDPDKANAAGILKVLLNTRSVTQIEVIRYFK